MNDCDQRRCAYCSTQVRILTFSSLKRGDHICMPGEKYKCNLFKKQYSLYKHHAIVKSAVVINGSLAKLNLIHCISSPFSTKNEIRETTELKSLYRDEIYKVQYRHPTTSPDKIIQNAEDLLKKSNEIGYSLPINNCEHFANICVMDVKISHQVGSSCDELVKSVKAKETIIGRTYDFILRAMANGIDDAVVFFKDTPIMFGVICLVVIPFTIYKLYKLYKRWKNKEICKKCFSKNAWHRIISLCTYLATDAIGYVLILYASTTGIAALVFSATIVISVISMYIIPNAWKSFKGPFQGKQIPVKEMKEVTIGDVVSFRRLCVLHDGIISSVEPNQNNPDTICTFGIVHYARPSFFSRYQIVEDSITIDLKEMDLLKHDYSGYHVYPPDEVVRRAKLRLGEKKFALFSNRSPHVCFWAKVNEDYTNDDTDADCENSLKYVEPFIKTEDDENLAFVHVKHKRDKTTSNCKIGQRPIRIREEIYPGALIQFQYNVCFYRKAICIEVRPLETPSQVEITSIHYKGPSSEVVKDTKKFDLNHDEIELIEYHPICRYRKEDIIRRAEAMVGDKRRNIITRRYNHFADEAVCKEREERIKSFSDIHPGDVIIYRYWSFKHEAIVLNVNPGCNQSDDQGTIEIAHYGLENLFGTREIMKERKEINVKEIKISKKLFDRYVTYPVNIVLKRAESRVGETRFHISGNRSPDFVHWCKVIQSPTIMSLNSEKFILIPLTGKARDGYHEEWIKTWDELTLGSIYKVDSYLGILVATERKSNKITLAVYNKGTRKVKNLKITVDFKKSNDWVYVYSFDPNDCYCVEEVIVRAKNRHLYEIPAKSSSLDFCKICLLKK